MAEGERFNHILLQWDVLLGNRLYLKEYCKKRKKNTLQSVLFLSAIVEAASGVSQGSFLRRSTLPASAALSDSSRKEKQLFGETDL